MNVLQLRPHCIWRGCLTWHLNITFRLKPQNPERNAGIFWTWLLIFPHQMPVVMWRRNSLLTLPNLNCKHSSLKPMGAMNKNSRLAFKCRGAPWNSIPGSNTQSTVAYLGPLYGKVVGVAIYSIHILYSTVNIIIFGQNWQPDKDMFVTVCICMNYFKRK